MDRVEVETPSADWMGVGASFRTLPSGDYPTAIKACAEYFRMHLDQTHSEAADDMEAMAHALQEIAQLGRAKPGHGYSCATIAINTLEKINDQDT